MMLTIDEISLLVTVDTDEAMDEIEKTLNLKGYTLNYRPLYGAPLLAQVLQQRIPNLYQQAFGGIEDLCLQARWAQASGEVFTNVATPRSATGPSFKKMAIGSGEAFGIPIQATLKIFPWPEEFRGAWIHFSKREQRDFFRRALLKHDLAVPLLAPLPVDSPCLQGSKVEGEVLGLGIWGGHREVLRMMRILQELAESKEGEWSVVPEKRQEKFLLQLEEEVRAFLFYEQEAQADLPEGHLQLHQRILGSL